MHPKEEILRLLGNLSLHELQEIQNFIATLITVKDMEKKSPGKDTHNNHAFHEQSRQERFSTVFSCRFQKTNEPEISPLPGIIIDISKTGLLLKTDTKIDVGSILIAFPKIADEINILAISPYYDRLHKRVFLEVIRAKESTGLYELGCKFLPHDNVNLIA